ncbi:MAG: tetratricopeptide repeat protein [Pirellulaceae bacterium]
MMKLSSDGGASGHILNPPDDRAAEELSGIARRLLLTSLVVCLLATSGCHSLRARRQTRELSDARQSSLRGAEKLQQHKLDEAELLFTDALRSSSADERAQAGMAEVLWQRDESDKAIEHMTQAAVISGGNPDYLVRLGEMNLQQGNLKQALAQADAALEGQRSHAGAWALRGKVLQQRGELEAAMSCYHRTLNEQPHAPQVQVALAEIYRDLGRPQRALATLDRMTDGKTGEQISPQAWMLKGQALADLGEASAANHCLRNAALCCRDEDTSTIISIARLQMEAGDIAEARTCLCRAFQHDPYNPTALQLQAMLDRGPAGAPVGGAAGGLLGTVPARLVGFERAPPAN